MVFKSLLMTFFVFALMACGKQEAPMPDTHGDEAHVDKHGHADHQDEDEHETQDDSHDDEHSDEHGHGHADEHGHSEAEEPPKGSHGGRLLEQAGYAIELKIFEDGVPPEYRVWIYRNNKPLPPNAAQVSVTLTRLGQIKNTFKFKPQADYLLGDAEVVEPHSFVVEVQAKIDNKNLRWQFDSFEGRTHIERKIADQSGIKVGLVSAGQIEETHEVQGLLTTIEGRHANVVARFPGPIRRVNVSVGDRVRSGQILAVIESNISLSNYNVVAPFAGTVMARNVTAGDMASDQALFEIADLSKLWVDLHLFGSDAQNIRAGLPVKVVRLSDQAMFATQLERVLPSTATASQSTVARAILNNQDGQWRPGAAVQARVTIKEKSAAMVVPLTALQKFRDWDVVFVRIDDDFEIRPLQLGERDAENVEVLTGLGLGDEIVIEQSYLVKADIEKSGASHDH